MSCNEWAFILERITFMPWNDLAKSGLSFMAREKVIEVLRIFGFICRIIIYAMDVFQEDIDKCLKVLQKGGLILYPTDTVWGIGCDATNEEAVSRIYALKQREDSKKMIVLMGSERELMQYATQIDIAIFDYLDAQAKPTTVIYEDVIGLAENILGKDGSVAIRLCDEPFCKTLIKRFRKPIVSTSANISGQPTPGFFFEIAKEILGGVDYVVRYRQEDVSIKTPSSVIKWEKDGSITTIR